MLEASTAEFSSLFEPWPGQANCCLPYQAALINGFSDQWAVHLHLHNYLSLASACTQVFIRLKCDMPQHVSDNIGARVGLPKDLFTPSCSSPKQEAFELQERRGNTSGPDQSVLLESALLGNISQR